MGQRQGNRDGVASALPEAVSQMPEQHVQPRIDLALAHDCSQDRQVARTKQRAPDQSCRDLGIRSGSPGELRVQDHQPCGNDVGRERTAGLAGAVRKAHPAGRSAKMVVVSPKRVDGEHRA